MNNNTPINFDFNSTNVRIVVIEGDPWFVAADVAKALGFSHTPSLVRKLDEDEKGVHIAYTLGGPQQVTIISESGLYEAILNSRMPEAREFKRWVRKIVLPSIRKHGGYIANQENESDPLVIMANAVKVADGVIRETQGVLFICTIFSAVKFINS